jgi:hypothetical protein
MAMIGHGQDRGSFNKERSGRGRFAMMVPDILANYLVRITTKGRLEM